MASNYQQLYPGKGNVGFVTWKSTTTANSKSDGTGTIGTDMLLAFTADATYGAQVDKIRIVPQGSVASTPTTASVARIYISSQTAGATTNSNTWLFKEVKLSGVITDQATQALNPTEIDLGFSLPPGYTILVSMPHAAATGTSWAFLVFGGDYVVVP